MVNSKIIKNITGENKAALIIFILMGLLPIFVSGYIIFILPQYMLFGLLAVSLCILWGYSGIISFGQAAFFAIGAYTMGIVIREGGGAINPAYIGIVCGALLSGIVALIVGYFLFSVKVRSTYFVLATLALSIIVEQLAKSQKDITGGWNGLFVDRITLTMGPFIEYSLYNDCLLYTSDAADE